MASFTLQSTFVTITMIIITGHSNEVLCDNQICDFGTCNKGNDCQYNQYICTDKASQCLLQCVSNCNDISIISSAQYTEIICRKLNACTDVQISVLEPNNALYLECRTSSCLNVSVQSNEHSTFECQDYDGSECRDNVNTIWIADETPVQTTTTIKPTIKPTSQPTIKPILKSPSNHILKPTISIPITETSVTSPKPQTPTIQRLRETVIITKTIVIFANQTSASKGSWIALGIFSFVFMAVTCVAIIGVKIFKNDVILDDCNDNSIDKQSNIVAVTQRATEPIGAFDSGTASCHMSPESDIYRPYTTSEGDIDIRLNACGVGECADIYDGERSSYDGLYEGGNSPHINTEQYIEVNDNQFDRIHIATEQQCMSFDALDDYLPEETIVASLTSDGLDLLYGPGSGKCKTRGPLYED